MIQQEAETRIMYPVRAEYLTIKHEGRADERLWFVYDARDRQLCRCADEAAARALVAALNAGRVARPWAHTPGPWRVGVKGYGEVVTDDPDAAPDDYTAELWEGYGGVLIAESIAPRNRALIAAAPDLVAVCELSVGLLRAALAAGRTEEHTARAYLAQVEHGLAAALTALRTAEEGSCSGTK